MSNLIAYITLIIAVALGTASNGFATNKCIVGRGGSNIQGSASDLDLTANNQCVTLIFTTATKGWQIKTNSTS